MKLIASGPPRVGTALGEETASLVQEVDWKELRKIRDEGKAGAGRSFPCGGGGWGGCLKKKNGKDVVF